MELLTLLNRIEAEMGRIRNVPLGPRIIDLDILLIDDLVIDSEQLTVPHPRLHERKFALAPILEIDASATHPRFGRPLREFLAEADSGQLIEQCGKEL